MNQPTGFYPRVRVRDDGRTVVSQAGSPLLVETVRKTGLDGAVSAALAPWRKARRGPRCRGRAHHPYGMPAVGADFGDQQVPPSVTVVEGQGQGQGQGLGLHQTGSDHSPPMRVPGAGLQAQADTDYAVRTCEAAESDTNDLRGVSSHLPASVLRRPPVRSSLRRRGGSRWRWRRRRSRRRSLRTPRRWPGTGRGPAA